MKRNLLFVVLPLIVLLFQNCNDFHSLGSAPREETKSSVDLPELQVASQTSSGGTVNTDLRPYFLNIAKSHVFRKPSGVAYSNYTIVPASADFSSLYNKYFDQKKPGQQIVWRKQYAHAGGTWCTATYANLFLGDDMSVTEVGDWYAEKGSCTPNVAFGYKSPDGKSNDGLAWAPVGGFVGNGSATKFEIQTIRQLVAGGAYVNSGYRAYNITGLVKLLPTFTPAYGNKDGTGWRLGGGKTYTNVVRIIFYHGTRQPGQTNFSRCSNLDSSWGFAPYYRPQAGYNSYVSEYYMAEGVGFIQESFISNESEYWGAGLICKGLALGTTAAEHQAAMESFINYIDDP